MARQCRTCGGPIERKSAKAVYCSQRCCDRWNHLLAKGEVERPVVRCGTCGTDVAWRKGGTLFCSTKCKNAHHNARQDHQARRFGISKDEVARRVAEQGGCAICGTSEPKDAVWAVDHDHSCCPDARVTCGRCVRGILCRNCNAALGLFGDNVEVLMSAAAYLLSGQDVLAKPTKVTS